MSHRPGAFCKLRKHSPPTETVGRGLFPQFAMSHVFSLGSSEQQQLDKFLEKRSATKRHVEARAESEV